MRFYFPDPFPGRSLPDIYPISIRAKSWLARASTLSEFSDTRSVQIAGGVLMLAGLDYHQSQFMAAVNRVTPYFDRIGVLIERALAQAQGSDTCPPIATDAERHYLDALDHEAVAYINRLGQFFYFAKSMKLDALIPRAGQLFVFRQKHAAHRSIDKRGRESPEMRELHAMAFNFSRLTQNSFPIYQILDNGRHITLHMRDDHLAIMDEAMQLFQRLHLVH